MYNFEEFMSDFCKNEKMAIERAIFIREWEDSPPYTILFAIFGEKFVEDFDIRATDEQMRLLLVIEGGMNTSDVDLRNYVATGLLEALYSHSKRLGKWEEISKFLGKNSIGYIDAWNAFCEGRNAS